MDESVLHLSLLNNEVTSLDGLNTADVVGYEYHTLSEGAAPGVYFLPEYAGKAQADDPNGTWRAGDELVFDNEGNLFPPHNRCRAKSRK